MALPPLHPFANLPRKFYRVQTTQISASQTLPEMNIKTQILMQQVLGLPHDVAWTSKYVDSLRRELQTSGQ